MTLGEKQRLFSKLLAELILHAYEAGYELAIGEGKRSDEQAEINALGEDGRHDLAALIDAQFPMLATDILNNGAARGIRGSLHELKLAQDLDLFKDGQYLDSTEAHRALGEWWKLRHELCCWGGDFNDGNHYSLTHGGRR